MNKNVTLTVTLAIIMVAHLAAQSFLNGSFENTTGECNYNIQNSTFNDLMENCYGFGIASQIDIISNSCTYGAAQNGQTFLGLAIDISNAEYDGLSIELDNEMTTGTDYHLSFFQRRNDYFEPNRLVIGYSDNNTLFGNPIDTIPFPTSDITWDSISLNFTPIMNAKHITVQTVPGEYGWNFIDNFKLEPGIPSSTENTGYADNIKLYPNPSTDYVNIELPYIEDVLKIEIYDMMGKLLFKNYFRNSKKVEVSIKGFVNGIYLIKLEHSGSTYTKRIIKT